MPLWTFFVHDYETAKMVPGAFISYSGRWEGFLSSGALKGEGHTDDQGRFSFSINNGVSVHLEYTSKATGYDTAQGASESGTITGDYGTHVWMKKSRLAQPGLPGTGFEAEVKGPLEETLAGAGGTLAGLGTWAAVILVVLAIAITIIVVALAVVLR